jgi:hypothetical protein
LLCTVEPNQLVPKLLDSVALLLQLALVDFTSLVCQSRGLRQLLQEGFVLARRLFCNIFGLLHFGIGFACQSLGFHRQLTSLLLFFGGCHHRLRCLFASCWASRRSSFAFSASALMSGSE